MGVGWVWVWLFVNIVVYILFSFPTRSTIGYCTHVHLKWLAMMASQVDCAPSGYGAQSNCGAVVFEFETRSVTNFLRFYFFALLISFYDDFQIIIIINIAFIISYH